MGMRGVAATFEFGPIIAWEINSERGDRWAVPITMERTNFEQTSRMGWPWWLKVIKTPDGKIVFQAPGSAVCDNEADALAHVEQRQCDYRKAG
jgi:hypothetical protein